MASCNAPPRSDTAQTQRKIHLPACPIRRFLRILVLLAWRRIERHLKAESQVPSSAYTRGSGNAPKKKSYRRFVMKGQITQRRNEVPLKGMGLQMPPRADPNLRHFGLSASASNPIVLILDENPLGRAVQVIILAAVQGPQEQQQGTQPDRQCRADDGGDLAHLALPAARRRAFIVTASEDPAIMKAASSGETRPSMASGMAATL